MVGLAEIDELDEEVTVDHDVVGLEVEVDDAVVADVAQGLGDGEDEVELGEHGDGVAVGPEVLFEVLEGDEVHDHCLAEEAVLVDGDVVLRQEDRKPVLDALQDLYLMVAATPLAAICVLLDDDVLMQGRTALPVSLLVEPLMPLGGVDVFVVDLGDVYFGEAAFVDLVVVHLADVVDEDVVEHHVVLEGVFVALLHRHCDHCADVLQLLHRQVVILLLVRLVALQEAALLEQLAVAGQPTLHALTVLQQLLYVDRPHPFLLPDLSLGFDVGLVEVTGDADHLQVPVVILPNLLDLVLVIERQFVLVVLF